MKSAYPISVSLNYAIRTATAQRGDSKAFSRKSPLTRETVIRLLIGAEGGSLDKILHTAGEPRKDCVKENKRHPFSQEWEQEKT